MIRKSWLYPAKDLMFYQADIQGNLLTRQRIRVLKALLEQKKVRVITSLGSCMEYLMPLEAVKQGILRLFAMTAEVESGNV